MEPVALRVLSKHSASEIHSQSREYFQNAYASILLSEGNDKQACIPQESKACELCLGLKLHQGTKPKIQFWVSGNKKQSLYPQYQ